MREVSVNHFTFRMTPKWMVCNYYVTLTPPFIFLHLLQYEFCFFLTTLRAYLGLGISFAPDIKDVFGSKGLCWFFFKQEREKREFFFKMLKFDFILFIT